MAEPENVVVKRLREALEQLFLIRSDLDSLRRRVEAIEERHERLDQGLLALRNT
jgi:hypothetical protein